MKKGDRIYIKRQNTIQKLKDWDTWASQVPGDWARQMTIRKKYEKYFFVGTSKKDENIVFGIDGFSELILIQVSSYSGNNLLIMRIPRSFIKSTP